MTFCNFPRLKLLHLLNTLRLRELWPAHSFNSTSNGDVF